MDHKDNHSTEFGLWWELSWTVTRELYSTNHVFNCR